MATARRNQAALEGGNGLDDVVPAQGVVLARKRRRETRGIGRVIAQALQHLRAVAVIHAHLHRLGAKQRRQHLLLQRGDRGVGPVEGGAVGHVGQRLRVARMHLSRGAARQRTVFGKGIGLCVAAAAGLRAIARQPHVMEQMPAQLDLGTVHGVVGRHHGRAEAGRQIPDPGLRARLPAGRINGRADGRAAPAPTARNHDDQQCQRQQREPLHEGKTTGSNGHGSEWYVEWFAGWYAGWSLRYS